MSRTSSSRELLDRAAPGPDFTLLVEVRDFLRVHLPKLTPKERSTLLAWAGGKTCNEIAREEGLHRISVHERLSRAITKLRELTK